MAAEKIVANRIKNILSTKLTEYKGQIAALTGADEESLQKRFDHATDFNNYLTGLNDAGQAFGASETELKSVQAVKRTVELDIERLENEAEVLDLLK